MPRGAISKRSARPGGVGPSGAVLIPAGENQSGLINGFLAAGTPVELAAGIHGLGAAGGPPDPLITKDGSVIFGQGDEVTYLEPRWLRLAAAADDPTNDVIEVVGAKNLGRINTTLTASVMTNTARIPVAAVGALAVNQWIAIEGPNATDENGVTPNPLLSFSEMIQVDAAWGGASPIIPSAPTLQFHSAGAPAQTVQGVDPRFRVTLASFTIRAATANNIAVGIRCDYAIGFHIHDVGFEGMSRCGVGGRFGSRDADLFNLRLGQSCNGLISGESIAHWTIENTWSDGRGNRVHPQGIPRHPFRFRERCTSILVDGARLSHVTGGVRCWGGRACHFRNVVVDDWSLEDMRLRDATLGATGCFDTGAGNFAVDGEFQHNCSWVGCYANEGQTFANDPNTVGANYSWWLNDTQDSHFGDCGVCYYGRTPSTAYIGVTYPAIGMVLDDAWGNTLNGIRIEGVNYGFITLGGCQSDVDNLYLDGNCADTQPAIAIYLNNTSLDGSPRFNRVTFDTWGTKVWFGANFIGTPDYDLEIKEYTNRQSAFSVAAGLVVEARFTDVVLANNPGAGVNEFALVNLDPASPAGGRNILPGAAASQYSAVVVNAGPSNAGAGLILVCPLPTAEAWVNITAPAGGILVGDLLEGVGAAGVVNNASVFPNCIGKSRDATAAGAVVRCVRIGKA